MIKKYCSLALALLLTSTLAASGAIAAVAADDDEADAATGNVRNAATAAAIAPAASEPKLTPPSPEAVELAKKARNIRYSRTCKGGAHTTGAWFSTPPIVLAVAAHTGDASADAKLLEQIRYNLKGENGLSANGGYPAQHERQFTGAVAIMKHTPRVWAKLTQAEKHKVDLLMRAALVASAYTTSDRSYADGRKVTALDGDTNMNRGWNPNFQEGMIGMMVVGTVYFGGGEATQKVLDDYKHEDFVAQLKAAGLTNTWETFNWKKAKPTSAAPTGEEIEQMIRQYRYQNIALTDPMAIYHKLTLNTYGATVNAGLNNGRGITNKNGKQSGLIAAGADELPNVGKVGMLKEFDSGDAGGKRSCAHYSYDGFRPNLTNHIVLIIGGQWRDGEMADECLARLNVGIPDLWYKLDKGYISYSKGKGADNPFSLRNDHYDFKLTRSLWEDVVKPYHEARAKARAAAAK